MKKKYSEYELVTIRQTIKDLNRNTGLMALAFTQHFLSAPEIEKFKNHKRLEQVLIFSETPQEMTEGFKKIDWGNLENVCDILYASANRAAVDCAPIQWWDSKHSKVDPLNANNLYAMTGLYTRKSVETEWLVCYFFNYRAYHSFSNIRITHNFGGEAVAKDIQKSLWESLKKKGLTGSTQIYSSAFCGVPARRKILDVCLIYEPDSSYTKELIESTNWNEPSSREDTLFAMGVLNLNDQGPQFNLGQKLGEYFKNYTFNFDKKYGSKNEDILLEGKTILPSNQVSLCMSALKTLMGVTLPSNLQKIKKQVLTHYQNMPSQEQIATVMWLYENDSDPSEDSLSIYKELMKYSAPQTTERLLSKIVTDQCLDNRFVETYHQPGEIIQLGFVLENFAAYKKPLLGRAFLEWVVSLGTNATLSAENEEDIQGVKSWCQYPETFLELVETFKHCKTHAEIKAWAQSSTIKIELLEQNIKNDKKLKRKI